MLKEQIIGLAMKAYSEAFAAREKFRAKLKSESVKSYLEELKDLAKRFVSSRLEMENTQKTSKSTRKAGAKKPVVKKSAQAKTLSNAKTQKTKKVTQAKSVAAKKTRKSSIKPVSEIISKRAELILTELKNSSSPMVKKNDELKGKKSLAYLVWALGHAEKAKITEGVSVHDVSSLLHKACKIELYPINISRVVHSNSDLVMQAGQEKRTKTYLLSEEGKKVFAEKFS